MKAMGIRVTRGEIFYCVVESTPRRVVPVDVRVDRLVVPQALDIPAQLAYIRTSLLSILTQHEVVHAGIRVVENNSQTLDRYRLNIEGVVQELLADSTVEKYFAGPKGTMARFLSVPVKDVTRVIEGADFAMVANWQQFRRREERESIVAAVAAMNIQ